MGWTGDDVLTRLQDHLLSAASIEGAMERQGEAERHAQGQGMDEDLAVHWVYAVAQTGIENNLGTSGGRDIWRALIGLFESELNDEGTGDRAGQAE